MYFESVFHIYKVQIQHAVKYNPICTSSITENQNCDFLFSIWNKRYQVFTRVTTVYVLAIILYQMPMFYHRMQPQQKTLSAHNSGNGPSL